MKQLTEPKREKRATNCTGRMEWFVDQDFEVEPSDVNTRRDHYQGFNYKTYKFVADDVGKRIRVTSQGDGYRCWWFPT